MKILDLMKAKLRQDGCDVDNKHDRRRTDDPEFFGYFAPEGFERRRCGSIFE